MRSRSPFARFEELTAIAAGRACFIAKVRNHELATADDLFLGIYDAAREEPIRHTFCLLIGLPDRKLAKEIRMIYKTEELYYKEHKHELKPDHYNFVEPLQSKLKPFHGLIEPDLDLLMLLDWCIDELSDEFKSLLKTRKTSYETIRSNIKNLINLQPLQQMGFTKFLVELDMMIDHLNLDLSDIDTMKIQQSDAQNINQLLNGMDSEILEKPESEKSTEKSVDVSDTKPKKKEEKKLTIEYF